MNENAFTVQKSELNTIRKVQSDISGENTNYMIVSRVSNIGRGILCVTNLWDYTLLL